MSSNPQISQLVSRLEAIRRSVIGLEEESRELLGGIQERHRRSAANLLHYVALRRHDLRETQSELAQLGLSSLGRCERWVLGNLDAVIAALHSLGGSAETESESGSRLTMDEGHRLIQTNAHQLLGMEPERVVRIMVTMPTEAAEDYALVRALVKSGMNVMRINCAHDDESVWTRMIEHRDRACEELNAECRVYMDLAGPNPRTVVPGGEIENRRFRTGDRFIVSSREPSGVRAADEDPPRIYCTHSSVIEDLAVGDRFLINDGKLASIVVEADDVEALLEVTSATSSRGKKLKDEKGINLPDTQLSFPSLTEADHSALPFIVERADMVGYSFVRTVEDVEALQARLAELGGESLGIVLKIETIPAFCNLPHLLLAAMKSRLVGVMIARGDMAVEAGFERLSEIQEEVLWFCEAAHVPLVWATQVLQTFVKEGLPGRGEITDAAMGGRAECIMMNKGPHIVEAVETLDDILTRMKGHQDKKRSMFRPLSISTTFEEFPPPPVG